MQHALATYNLSSYNVLHYIDTLFFFYPIELNNFTGGWALVYQLTIDNRSILITTVAKL